MTWGRLDDKLHEHRKSHRAGTAAMGLWVLANSWCCDNWKTDGFVPERIIQRFGSAAYDVAENAATLVKSGLWFACEMDDEPGYRFHDWDQSRPTAEREALGGTYGNHKRWHVSRLVTSPDCEFCISAGHPATSGANRPDIAPVPEPDPVAEAEAVPERTRASAIQTTGSPVGFDSFWDVYPRKDGKARAENAFRTACREVSSRVLFLAAVEFAKWHEIDGTETKFIPYAATWLNGKRWTDERPPAKPAATKLSTTDQRVTDAVALSNRLKAEEANEPPPARKAIGQ